MLKFPQNIDYIDVMSPRLAFIIRKMCENYNKGIVLDVGCGNGKITQYLGSIGVDILGVDIDENEIKKAVDSNEHENVQFACVEIKNITEKKFPGILLTEVLEHTEEPLNFLNELYRLCENNGFLILTVPNGYSPKETLMAGVRHLKNNKLFAELIKWYRKAIGRDKECNESPHLQRFTLKKIQSLIEESGFTIKEYYCCDIWSGFLWMYFPWIPIPFFVRKIERNITNYISYKLLGDLVFICLKKSKTDIHLNQFLYKNITK